MKLNKDIVTYKDLLNLNKKKFKEIKLKKLKNYFKSALNDLEVVIDIYKELYCKTEYWENKSTLDFDFINWNRIRKVNGRLTRYYNELKQILTSCYKK